MIFDLKFYQQTLMRLLDIKPMASPGAKIKQEVVDRSYESEGSCNSMVHTKVLSSPKSSRGSPDEATTSQPLTKRRRIEKDTASKLNGHANDTEEPSDLCLGPPYEHHDQGHSSALLSQLDKMRHEEQFVDVVLVVDGKELPCHKVVLCSVSDYFAELLVPNSATRYQQRLYVNETTSEIMIQLIDYAYTSKIKITEHNIEQLIIASKILKFSSVNKACINLLKYRLAADNCIHMWRYVEQQCGCPELVEWVMSFIRHHYERIVTSKEFLKLSSEELLSLISSKKLNVQREETVYESVMLWITHDPSSRKEYLPLLLEHVRLPLVKPQFLLDVVETDAIIKNNKECEKYLNEAKRYQLLPEQRPIMQSCRTQPRLSYSSKKAEVLVTVGGLNKEKTPLQDCTYIDFPNPSPKHISPLQVSQSAYSVAVVNNNIFVSGGVSEKPCSDVWMYIPSLDKWKQVAPMKRARYLHASVGLDGFLYVIGGHDGVERLRSIERYNPDTNSWSDFQPMLKNLSSPTAVACAGQLFVIGGATGSSPKDIVADVLWFNPETEAWQQMAPLPHPERGAVAANLEGTIYVMGKGKSVIAYNRKTNKWSKCNNTIGGHLHGAATVHRGQLYVAGGLHGNTYLNGTVELYDKDSDLWQVTATLHAPVYAQGFVSIFKDSTPFSASS